MKMLYKITFVRKVALDALIIRIQAGDITVLHAHNCTVECQMRTKVIIVMTAKSCLLEEAH